MAALPIRYPELGERFTRLMDSKGWKTSKLAAIAGPDGTPVTFATIARMRKGQTKPRAALLRRLAEILQVTEDEIIGDAKTTRPSSTSTVELGDRGQIAAGNAPQPGSFEWKMARIISIKQQIAFTDGLKPELARLLDDVAVDLQTLKSMTEASS